MTKFISDLTLEEQNDLYSRYISNEPTPDLLDRFNIRLESKQLFCNIPDEVLEEKCTICSGNLLRRRQPKTLIKYKNNNVKYCSKCRHREETNCNCSNCRNRKMDEKKLEETSEKGLIANLLHYKKVNEINFKDLALTDKIYLGAFLREGISEDYTCIKPIRKFINPLAPTNYFGEEITDRLMNIYSIAVHPSTNPKFVEILDYENGSFRYTESHVQWSLNLRCEELDKFAIIESLINPEDLDNSQYSEALQLWKKIALYESIEYLKCSINKFLGSDYKIGYKTEAVLSDLTNYFSVAQIYGIINKAVMKAVILRAAGEVSRKGAVNTIPGYVERIGERAKIKNRDLKKHKRVKACPESALSKFFFERVIKIGTEGFSEVPNINKIKSKLSETA
jgi:hypothetical protein